MKTDSSEKRSTEFGEKVNLKKELLCDNSNKYGRNGMKTFNRLLTKTALLDI
jgi:hypothetical protein